MSHFVRNLVSCSLLVFIITGFASCSDSAAVKPSSTSTPSNTYVDNSTPSTPNIFTVDSDYLSLPVPEISDKWASGEGSYISDNGYVFSYSITKKDDLDVIYYSIVESDTSILILSNSSAYEFLNDNLIIHAYIGTYKIEMNDDNNSVNITVDTEYDDYTKISGKFDRLQNIVNSSGEEQAYTSYDGAYETDGKGLYIIGSDGKGFSYLLISSTKYQSITKGYVETSTNIANIQAEGIDLEIIFTFEGGKCIGVNINETKPDTENEFYGLFKGRFVLKDNKNPYEYYQHYQF